MPLKLGGGTTHVLPAAHGRLDLAMTIWTLGNLYFISVRQFQRIVFECGVAVAAGGVDTHAALFTFIGCHFAFSPHVFSNWFSYKLRVVSRSRITAFGRFGSLADVFTNISLMSAFECIADV